MGSCPPRASVERSVNNTRSDLTLAFQVGHLLLNGSVQVVSSFLVDRGPHNPTLVPLAQLGSLSAQHLMELVPRFFQIHIAQLLIGTRLFHRRMQVRVGRHTDRPRRHSTRRRRDRHRHLRRRRGVVHRARRHAHDARVRKPERSAAVFLCVPDIFFGEVPPFYFCMQAKGDTHRNRRTPDCP